MEFNEVVYTRRSIRAYSEQEVEEAAVERVLRAAMAAPSAGNQQPWQFIVIRDREKREAIPAIHPYARMVLQAPVAILVCGDPDGKKYPQYWQQDCSAATQNLLLAARDQGLGTVWCGVYPDQTRIDGFRKLLAIPSHILPFALVPLGWPGIIFQAVERFNPAVIHYEQW
jgi:nitroreductase